MNLPSINIEARPVTTFIPRHIPQGLIVEHAYCMMRKDLYGAKVALVGPVAPDLDKADDYDFVFKVNNHAQDQEGRCNGIYSGAGDEIELTPDTRYLLFNATGPKRDQHWRVIMDRKVADRPENNLVVIPFVAKRFRGLCHFGPEFNWHNEFAWQIGCTPFTGITAIYHLLTLSIKELFVTGFTFYNDEFERGPHHDPYLPGNLCDENLMKCSHKIMPQLRWLRRTYELDDRLHIDAELESVIVDNTYDAKALPEAIHRQVLALR